MRPTVRPERALRLLDSLDGVAYAVRLASAGYWGGPLRLVLLATGVAAGFAAAARLPSF